MTNMKSVKLLALALLAAAVLGTSSIALAESGSSGSDSNSGRMSESGETETETEHMISPEKRAEFRRKAAEQLSEMQAEHKSEKAKSQQQRQKACEAHKQGLAQKFSRIVTKSERFQAKIDKILSKAKAYQADKNLTVENWNALLQAATDAQSASAASIADLTALSPTIDCNSTSTASDVAAFKAAAATTRDNLKTYKSSVKDLLKALRDAKQAANGQESTEGSQQ